MSIFTIENGHKPTISRYDDQDTNTNYTQDELREIMAENPSLVATRPVLTTPERRSDYTEPLFQIAGFGVSHMHIDLVSVALMALFVISSLVSHFRR